jgi:hypothetical protein
VEVGSSAPWPPRRFAGRDTGEPHPDLGTRARPSDDADAIAARTWPLACSTRSDTSPALHRVSTGGIPASPGLRLGPVPTGLVLVVEVVLVGLTATPPPDPCPHTPDPVQHGPPTSLPPRPTLTSPERSTRSSNRAGSAPWGHIGATSGPRTTGSQRTTAVTSGPASSQLTGHLRPSPQVAASARRSLTRKRLSFNLSRPQWGHRIRV